MTTLRDLLGGSNLENNLLDRLTAVEQASEGLKRGETVPQELTEMVDDLGLALQGEFRAGNGLDPGEGFSGIRIAYPSMTYDGSEWHIVGVSNDVLQFGLDAATGKALAGAGVVVQDVDGIAVAIADVYADVNSYRFTSGGVLSSQIRALHAGTVHTIMVHAPAIAGLDSRAYLYAVSPTGKDAQAILQAVEGGGHQAIITVSALTDEVTVSAAGGTTLSNGGLNVGTTGAGAGEIKANASITGTDLVLTAPTLTWHAVGSGGGEPAYQNSWADYIAGQGARFAKDALGNVHLRGTIKTGTPPSICFTLPAGYRPPAALYFPAVGNNAFAHVRAATNGDVTVQVGSATWTSLDGIIFSTL